MEDIGSVPAWEELIARQLIASEWYHLCVVGLPQLGRYPGEVQSVAVAMVRWGKLEMHSPGVRRRPTLLLAIVLLSPKIPHIYYQLGG